MSSKVCLITGASSGIGAGLAKRFAAQGARVSIAARREDFLTKVAEECKELGAKDVLKVVADLRKQEDIERIMTETIKRFGKLDVLVNNAGGIYFEDFGKAEWDKFNNLFAINTRAPFFLTQLALQHLEKTKGIIVNISSSTINSYSLEQSMIYSMTKTSLDYFTKSCALELASKGIRVNTVSVGSCFTENAYKMGWPKDDVDQFFKEDAGKQPLNKRLIEVDEIADAVLFLSSDAAKMITGIILPVDGGRALTGN